MRGGRGISDINLDENGNLGSEIRSDRLVGGIGVANTMSFNV